MALFSWFLRLQAGYPHGVLLAACFDLHINSEVADKFVFSNVFRIYLELCKSEALLIIFTLFTERQRCAGSLLRSRRQNSEC